MKRLYLCITIILFVSQIRSQNISMDDFRIPESKYKKLFGGIDGRFSDLNYGKKDEESMSAYSDLRFSLNTNNGFDNENESFIVQSLSTISYGQDSESKSNHLPFASTRKESNENNSMYIDFSGKYSSYLVPDEFYLYGSSSVHGHYAFDRTETDTNSFHERSFSSKNRTIIATLSTGIGYGKMRDASAVFSVVRIIEKLNEDRFLTRELTKEEILTLVDIVTIKNVYTISYDRPKKYLLDDILNTLLAMGVVKENRVSAYEVARIDEIFQESFSPWMVGFKVDVGFQLSRSQSENVDARYDILTKDFYRSDFNGIAMNAAHGKAFSLKLHWYTTIVVTAPIYDKIKTFNKKMNSTLTYQVSEKLYNEFNVIYSKEKQYYDPWTATISNNNLRFGNSIRYFIENNISFYLTINYYDSMSIEEKNAFVERRTSNGFEGYFGLNYRFY